MALLMGSIGGDSPRVADSHESRAGWCATMQNPVGTSRLNPDYEGRGQSTVDDCSTRGFHQALHEF